MALTQYVTRSHKWLQLPDETVAIYNAHDVVNTARLAAATEAQMRAEGQWDYYRQQFWPFIDVVRAMQRRGIGDLDKPARNQYRRKLRTERDDIDAGIAKDVEVYRAMEADLQQWYADYARDNPTKPKMLERSYASRQKKLEKAKGQFFTRGGPKNNTYLAQFLFDQLALKPAPPLKERNGTYKTGRSPRSTAQQALIYIYTHLRKKDEQYKWVLEDLFHRSRLNTILTRYLTIEGDPDGRIRPTIKSVGTETLRLAYAGDKGEAVQQWPAKARHIVRVRPGHVFIGRDYSQLEARIMAVLANDEPSLRMFRENLDIHDETTKLVFGYSDEQLSNLPQAEAKATRDFIKSIRYGLGYGGDIETMNSKLFCPCPREDCVAENPPTLDMTREEKRDRSDKFMALHSRLVEWRDEVFESVKGYGGDHSWTSPFGYRRFFLEPYNTAKRSIYNYPMQHCGSQIVNNAMKRLHYNHGAPLTLQMHDELVLEVPKEDANHWDEVLTMEMERPVPELGNTVFPTDGNMGETWGELK